MLKNLFARLGRYRLIMDRQDHEPYLERYYLFLRNRRWFPFNVFLHRFIKGDPDHLHDHPWPYATLIVRGGYWETTPQGRFWRGAGHLRFCGSRSLHRIELEPGVTAWTLFMPGPKTREWGFVMDLDRPEDTWVPHHKYLKHPE